MTIQKLKVVLKPEDWNLPVNELEMRCLKNLLLKIDELVDAVNNQQIQLNNHECRLLDLHSRITALDDPTYHEEPEPEYKNRNVKQAEKWMYHLCRFWNDGCDSYYGELVNIDTKVSSDAPFERDTGDWYQCCEPVKPDDDIIYKGE